MMVLVLMQLVRLRLSARRGATKLAEACKFERDLIRERTHAGLAAARARGRRGGRPSVMTAEKLRAARQLYDARQHTIAEIAATLGVSRAAVYRPGGRPDGTARLARRPSQP